MEHVTPGDGSGYGENYWTNIIDSYVAKFEVSNLSDENVTFAFWRSNANGQPANGGIGVPVRAGMLQEINGPLQLCSHAFHGTTCPPKWKGKRLWLVALYPPVEWQDDKCGSLKRKIIGEIK